MTSRCGYFLLLVASSVVHSAETVPGTTAQTTEAPLVTSSSAKEWGLSTEEWRRYQQLKQGERGIWSPSLDPLTTLGVEATSDVERRRYAELLVQKEALRVEKELAFQRAYDAAWQRRFPALSLVSGPPAFAPASKNNRLAVFVRENCSACDSRLAALLEAGNPLDIYLVDSNGDDLQLRSWGRAQHIDPSRVKRGDITLNHDAGRWQYYGRGKMPAVLEKQGDAWLTVTR